jgi:hypothetical protein
MPDGGPQSADDGVVRLRLRVGSPASIDGVSRGAFNKIKTKLKQTKCARKKTILNFIALDPSLLTEFKAGEENGELTKHVILIFRNGIHI